MDSQDEPDKQLTVSAISALHGGNKIEAIRIIRKEKGIGLKEAKDIVEEYLKIHPEIQSLINNHQAESIRGYLPWLITIIFVVVMAYIIFGI